MVIILMGAAGAGKTTVGAALASALGWQFVDADRLHSARSLDKMRAGMPLTDADRGPWLAAVRAVVSQALDRREGLVVACSALKERYRQTVSGGLRTVRWVYLRATESLLRERLAARPHHFFPPELVATQVRDLEEPADALAVEADWAEERIVGAVREAFGV